MCNNPLVTKYLKGVVAAKMDGRKDFLDTEHDYVRKKLIIVAEKCHEVEWNLIAYIEVEIFNIGIDGQDYGLLEPPVEAYRIPFPENRQTLAKIISLLRKYPRFYIA